MASAVERKTLYSVLGRRIATARQRRGWSQTQLAEKAGLTRGSVANIERGAQQAPLHSIWAIALSLELEPRLLIPTLDQIDGEAHLQNDGLSDLDPRAKQILEKLGPESRLFVSRAKGGGAQQQRRKSKESDQ